MTRIPTDLTDEQIPEQLGKALAGLYSGAARLPSRAGGRVAGLAALRAYNPKDYAARNHLLSPVSRLSMYLRHGMISPRELADHLRARSKGIDREEGLRQLAWREFFWLVLKQKGRSVLENLEEPKYRTAWSPELPDDVREARTGLPCADAWITHLKDDGYMHNHERMWFAAYLVHWRRVHWKAGYGFFREHLLDGDLASNALSWQWVASTFSGKPYIMNQANIEKYSAGRWCETCTAACPFMGSYEQLQEKLFGWRA